MALGLRLALLAWLLAKAESPLRYCSDGEYAYAGRRCCKFCPAGTYVGEHCAIPHTFGRCIPCIEGEDYTEHPNGLDQCLSCDECKPGYVMMRPCTAENNTVCQCPEGYYCPPGCEECIRCEKKCPEGQVQVQSCSPTTDMQCEPSPTERTDSTLQIVGIIIGLLVFLLFILGFLMYIKKTSRCKREKEKEAKVFLIPGVSDILNTRTEVPAADRFILRNEVAQNGERSNLLAESTNEESTSGNVLSAPLVQLPQKSVVRSVPSKVLESKKPVVRVINSSSKDLNDIYFDMRKRVPPRDWNELMRKSGLSDNDIEKIRHDNPNHMDEAFYQMLKTLQDRFGIDGALYKLLDGLWDLELKSIYENVTNQLISDNIIILETKD